MKDFFSKYDQICRKLQILSHLLKKSSMENFIFCAVGSLEKRDRKIGSINISRNGKETERRQKD